MGQSPFNNMADNKWSGPFLVSQRDRVDELIAVGILKESSRNAAYRAAMEFYISHMLRTHDLEKEAISKAKK